ncbi:MAG TPA: O-antigen ligase family protein [Chitinophagaceae bacterium]
MGSLAVNTGFSPFRWLKQQLIEKRFNSVAGYIFMALLAVSVAYLSLYAGYKITLGVVGVVGFIMVGICCVLYPYFGYYTTIVVSCLIFSPERLFGLALPYGFAIEIYSYLTLLGALTQSYARKEINRDFWRHPVTICMIVLFGFFTIQAINPSLHSKLGWFNYYRKFISFFAFYFLTYCLLNSKERIRFFLKFWVFIITFLALYACKQQWLGFFDWETAWIVADEKRLELLYQTGLMRKFSLLSDPAASGVLFAAFMVMLLILGLRTSNKKHKYWLYAASLICFLGFSYSGTRTSNLILIGGIFFYALATINEKRTIRFVTIGAIGFILLLSVPIYNPVLIRIRSTFEGSKDPSAAFRDMNRKRIQPYIYSHPIGGGINTCIPEGLIYSPGHYLASFPSDSGYLKIAVEQGWIGLALALIFYYLILRTGIKNFYRARAPEIRMWYIAALGYVFGLLVGQFSQIVIGQYPTIFLYYGSIVIFMKLVNYEKPKPETENI